MLENLDKYINYFKATQKDNKNIYIPFNNFLYDTKLLKNFVAIYGGKFDNIKQQKRDFAFVTSNNDIESIILSLRPNDEMLTKYNQIFNDFKKQLSNN